MTINGFSFYIHLQQLGERRQRTKLWRVNTLSVASSCGYNSKQSSRRLIQHFVNSSRKWRKCSVGKVIWIWLPLIQVVLNTILSFNTIFSYCLLNTAVNICSWTWDSMYSNAFCSYVSKMRFYIFLSYFWSATSTHPSFINSIIVTLEDVQPQVSPLRFESLLYPNIVYNHSVSLLYQESSRAPLVRSSPKASIGRATNDAMRPHFWIFLNYI